MKNILQNTVVRAIKNKVFINGTLDGYTVAAIDGTKFFGSNKKSCSECLTNQNHHFHSGAVMSIIGSGPKLTVGFQMARPGEDSTNKDEGEMNVAKRLISAVSSTYPNFIDVVVYDALACNAQWINHCLDLGLDVVIRAKKNNNSSIRAIKRKVHTLDPIEIWDHEKGFVRVSVSESNFLMDNVNCPLRFVKYAMKHPGGRRSQILIVTSCLETSLSTIFKMIRARWDIEFYF